MFMKDGWSILACMNIVRPVFRDNPHKKYVAVTARSGRLKPASNADVDRNPAADSGLRRV